MLKASQLDFLHLVDDSALYPHTDFFLHIDLQKSPRHIEQHVGKERAEKAADPGQDLQKSRPPLAQHRGQLIDDPPGQPQFYRWQQGANQRQRRQPSHS